MKLKITFLMAFLTLVLSSYSVGSINIKGVDYEVDTTFHAKVGPGTTQTSLALFPNGSTTNQLRVFYLTIDRTNPNIKMKAVLAKDRLAGNETVATMANRKSTENELYFCGVNGDFYYTSGFVGTPTGSSTVEGVPCKTSKSYKQMGVDADGIPWLGVTAFNGTAKIGTQTHDLEGINVGRGENNLILYTPIIGDGNTGTNAYGTEVAVELTEGEFKIGNTFKVKVTAAPVAKVGNMKIPENGFVLSGHGTAEEFIKDLKAGDIVEIENHLTVDGEIHNLINMSGGNPIIVGNGETLDTEGDRGDASARHPRTAAGYSADKSKIILMVIDGRALSVGVTTSMLGDVMRYAGAAWAMNWDGGCSSTLYTNALGVRNHCSDGKERAVGSAMFAVYTGTMDKEIKEIHCKDWKIDLPKNGQYIPVIYGYSQQGVLVDLDVQNVKFTCDEAIGRIEGNTFIAGDPGSGFIYAEYNGATTKIPVTVLESKGLKLRLSNVLNDGFIEYPIEVKSMVDKGEMDIAPSSLTWSSDNESVATVSEAGILKGHVNGTANITGTLEDFTGVLPVTVEIPTSAKMPVDNLDMNTWTITKTGAITVTPEQAEEGVNLNIEYAVTRGPYVQIAKSIALYSIPEAMEINMNTGDLLMTKIQVEFQLNSGSSEAIDITAPSLNKDTIIRVNMSDILTDKNDLINYPIKLSRIRFYLDLGNKVGKYTVKIPAINAVYKNFSSVEKNELLSNLIVFPNPARQGEENMYFRNTERTNISVNIYNIGGQLVKSQKYGMQEAGNILLPTSSLSTGTYFVQINRDNTTDVVKIVIK